MTTANWHVVFTQPHAERRAASDLCCLDGVDGFCPSVRVKWFMRHRLIEAPRPIIARVVFGRWDASDPHLWHDVRDTKGVRGILGGERPKPVVDRSLELWLASADAEWVIPGVALRLAYLKRGYWEGSEVCINYRALRGILGVVRTIDEATLSARVEYNMLGRPQWRIFPLRALSAVGAPFEAVG